MDARTRQIIENEKDPRVLRALITDLVEHNQKLKEVISKIERENAEKDQASFNLEERVKLLRRQIFGKSSEQRPDANDRPRDKSQEDALVFSRAAFPAPDTRSNEQKGKAKGSGLEEIVVDHHPSENDLVDESTSRGVNEPSASQWEDTGLYDESIKITLIERRYVKELHRRHKYRLKEKFNLNPEKEVIVTANGPPELLKGMNYSVDFLAAVIADKYISHMPLERQTREMESLGLRGIKNSTLSRMAALGAATLEPMQEAILRQDLLVAQSKNCLDILSATS